LEAAKGCVSFLLELATDQTYTLEGHEKMSAGNFATLSGGGKFPWRSWATAGVWKKTVG
jgi:hypothetical protein